MKKYAIEIRRLLERKFTMHQQNRQQFYRY